MTNRQELYRNIVIGLFLLFIFLIGGKGCINDARLGDGAYSIGKPFKKYNAHFRYEYLYEFYVNKKKYRGRSNGTNLSPNHVLGKYFYVKFEKGNPDNSEILFEKSVKDTNIYIPENGLDKIP